MMFASVGRALVVAALTGAATQPAELRVEGPVADAYDTAAVTLPADAEMAARVHAVAPDVVFSSRLAAAARSWAAALPVDDRTIDSNGLVDLALRRCGSPDTAVSAAIVRSTGTLEDDLWTRVATLLETSRVRPTHVGIGTAPSCPAPYMRCWGIILVRRRLEMEPFPTRPAPGDVVPLRFTLAGGLTAARVAVAAPGRAVVSAGAVADGRGWSALVPLDAGPGEYRVEVSADGRGGPEVVGLLSVWAGRTPPETWAATAVAPDVPRSRTAALRLARMVARERVARGVPPLRWDPKLAAVAEGHSLEMAACSLFAHRSPTSGAAGDRLQAISYPYRFVAENIARGASLSAAHRALMRSPGHRANLLSAEATHVGIGVARGTDDLGVDAWYITEVVARPRPPVDPARYAVRFLGFLAAHNDVEEHPAVSEVAAALARQCADPEGDGRDTVVETAQAMFNEAGLEWRAVHVEIVDVADPASLPEPEVLDAEGVRLAGLGWAPSSRDHRYTVVVIVAVVPRR